MAVNEQIVTGRKFRRLIDTANKTWQRISFWGKASDCEFNDGKNAEAKVGAINGITTDLSCEESTIAASAAALNQVNRSLGGITFGVDADGNYGYRKPGADTVTPFSSGAKIFMMKETSAFKKEGINNVVMMHIGDKSVDWTKAKKILAICVCTSSGSCGVAEFHPHWPNDGHLQHQGVLTSEDFYIYSWHISNGCKIIQMGRSDAINTDSDGKLIYELYGWQGQNGITNEKIITVIYY